jgi:hypothetical protein
MVMLNIFVFFDAQICRLHIQQKLLGVRSALFLRKTHGLRQQNLLVWPQLHDLG